MIDQRKRIRWANFLLSGVFATFGAFAVMGPHTAFTRALEAHGVDEFWAAIMIATGVCHLLVSLSSATRCPAPASGRSVLVWVNGASCVIMMWTFMLVGVIGGVYTPTVMMALWLSFALAAMTYSEARSSVKMRQAHYGYTSE